MYFSQLNETWTTDCFHEWRSVILHADKKGVNIVNAVLPMEMAALALCYFNNKRLVYNESV